MKHDTFDENSTRKKYLASYFIGSIGTIVIAVTSPSRRYAIILGTREISARMTSCRPTSFLIAVISAIIIVVAHPKLLDTVLIRTGEFVRSASVVWEQKIFFMWERNATRRNLFAIKILFRVKWDIDLHIKIDTWSI